MENTNTIYNGFTSETSLSQPSKPNFSFTRGDKVFSLIFMLIGILFISWGLWGGFRIGHSVTHLISTTVFTLCMFRRGIKRGIFPWLCVILSYISAGVFVITSNGAVKFWMFICQFILSAVWFDSLSGRRQENGDLGLIKNVFISTFGVAIPNMPYATAAVFSESDGRRKWVGKALIGIACALPVLFIVVPLLISSDTAFEGFIETVFDNIAATIFKVVLGVLITPFILGYCFGQKYLAKPEPRQSRFDGIDSTYIISFLSALSVCYLAYLFSQLAYFFSAFSGFLPADYEFNVSTYARRGFFELTVIAAINLIIIFAALLLSKKNNGKICITSRILCVFIGIFTLLITATALSKMVLYIQSFGMTVLRITTSAFMLFIGIVFIAVILRCFISRIQVLRTALIAATCILLVLGIGNINAVVAKYNVYAYAYGKLESVDVETLYDLGDEGVPYIVLLTRFKDDEIREAAIQRCGDLIDRYYEVEYKYDDDYDISVSRHIVKDKKYSKPEQWGFSRARAYKELEKYIERNDELYIKK